jgi:hypothetical protein
MKQLFREGEVKLRTVRVFVFFDLILLNVSLMLFRAGQANPSTVISIKPSALAVPVHTSFNVSIYIENVINLFGWQVRLSFNPSLLDFVNASVEGDFVPNPPWTFPVLENQSAGWVFLAEDCYEGVSGNGTLAVVTFNRTRPGECSLSLSHTKLIDNSPILVSTPPYLGDANGDMYVGTMDRIMFFYAITHEYDPRADFNGDGILDIFDVCCVDFNHGRNYNTVHDALQPVEISHDVRNGSVLDGPVGGIVIPIDKFGLLAPYVGLASTVLVVVVASLIYVKRVRRRTENQ